MFVEVKEKDFIEDSGIGPLVKFRYEWQFKPGQMVIMRTFDSFDPDRYVDMLAVVLKVVFSEDSCPEIVYGTFNRWRQGKWGGMIEGTCILGRYLSPVPFTEEHLKTFNFSEGVGEIPAGALFFVRDLEGDSTKVELVYPYRIQYKSLSGDEV